MKDIGISPLAADAASSFNWPASSLPHNDDDPTLAARLIEDEVESVERKKNAHSSSTTATLTF
jgi:hypothetical protein